jgi:hypothetical protein
METSKKPVIHKFQALGSTKKKRGIFGMSDYKLVEKGYILCTCLEIPFGELTVVSAYR